MAYETAARAASTPAPAGLLPPGLSLPQGSGRSRTRDAGKPSILGGAGLGALRAFMSSEPASEHYLRDTLAGAILGALKAQQGGRSQISLADSSIADLQANPRAALPALATLQRGAPDPAMQAYAARAIADLIMGAVK